jgi:hypothetical protein
MVVVDECLKCIIERVGNSIQYFSVLGFAFDSQDFTSL